MPLAGSAGTDSEGGLCPPAAGRPYALALDHPSASSGRATPG